MSVILKLALEGIEADLATDLTVPSINTQRIKRSRTLLERARSRILDQSLTEDNIRLVAEMQSLLRGETVKSTHRASETLRTIRYVEAAVTIVLVNDAAVMADFAEGRN